MPKLEQRLRNLKQEMSKFDNWFKRVLLREKSAIYAHKKNEMNNRFNEYYRFLEALESYDMITNQDVKQSINEINQKRIKEDEELVKTIWQD
jgi:hypothetical protein